MREIIKSIPKRDDLVHRQNILKGRAKELDDPLPRKELSEGLKVFLVSEDLGSCITPITSPGQSNLIVQTVVLPLCVLHVQSNLP